MKFEIKYYDIAHDAGVFAIPSFTRSEIVEASSEKALESYIAKKKDNWGQRYKKESIFGFDYTSSGGALKVSKYLPPKVKKIG